MQRYVSRELTHFVGKNLRNEIKDERQLQDEQYKILIKIIRDKYISYPPHHPRELLHGLKYREDRNIYIDTRNKFSNNDMIVPDMVCFCDIPIGDLSIHIRKYSRFGMSFEKSFLIERGANPVLYVEKNSAISYERNFDLGKFRKLNRSIRSEYFDEIVKLYGDHCYSEAPIKRNRWQEIPQKTECLDIGQFLFELLCYVKFFDSSKPDDDEDNYYMEREWRTPYYINFGIRDIQRIILPSIFSDRFRKDVPEYVGQITFSDEYE